MSNVVVDKKELAFELVASIRSDMDDIKTRFFNIGVALNKINDRMLYFDLGFDSITECAESLFDIKKSTCYDLMRVAFLCADKQDSALLAPAYKKFNQSQLVAVTSAKYSMKTFASMVKPEDPVALVKKARKYWDKVQCGGVTNFPIGQRWGSLQEFIDAIEKRLGISGDSRRPEKPVVVEVITEPTVSEDFRRLEKSAEEQADVEDVSYWDKPLREFLFFACKKKYQRMDYKTIFDPDNKGTGVLVDSDRLVYVMIDAMLEAFENDKTVLKRKFQEFFECRLGKFDYTFTLCGNKQGLKPFCGNLASFVVDYFMAERIALGKRIELDAGKGASKKKK